MTSLTLRIDNRIFSKMISTYSLSKEVTYASTITTASGKEIYRNRRYRPILTFSLIPYSDAIASRDYQILKQGEYEVVYTDPEDNCIKTTTMRLVSNLENVFLLDSVNGKRYYRGGDIQLRAIEVE